MSYKLWLSVAALVAVAGACAITTVERHLVQPGDAGTLDGRAPYLKAHLRSGYVYVLRNWKMNDSTGHVTGDADLYDTERVKVSSGPVDLPRDSVALFETNSARMSGAGRALTVMAGITGGIAVACASNPKACFGSCPTLYAPDSLGRPLLQAEGFSASIAPALEAVDVDALYRTRVVNRRLTLTLTNEALETHVLRYVDLIAVPRPAGGRVFVTPQGDYRAATDLQSATTCRASEGDCLASVASFDSRERFVATDSSDLGRREEIDLTFARPPPGDLGLVVAARQSLLTTFLIYQALAYMGSDATRWLASLNSGGTAAGLTRAEDALAKILGRIDVLEQDAAGNWELVGSTGETGPIATDTKVVPLRLASRGPVHLRLRLTKGLWRIDWLALTALGASVAPVRIAPAAVRGDSGADLSALAHLVKHAEPMITLPGDKYFLDYRLPDNGDFELFVETRGYYLEWMRREWIAETDARAARQIALDPAAMLRKLAPAFKKQEAGMEDLFWASRYAKH